MTETQQPPSTTDEIEDEAAWGFPDRHEPRWPASLAVVVALVLYMSLPVKFALGPIWALPILEGALLLPLTIFLPTRRPEESVLVRAAAITLVALLTGANLYSLVVLIHLLTTHGGIAGVDLLVRASQIWSINVLVFGLWYWELDRGGPGERMRVGHRMPDFLFPQMSSPYCSEEPWTPDFVDYTYVAFTNATAFSPTDTMPLTNWAKLLMMVQSFASLLTVTLVAARAVNILH